MAKTVRVDKIGALYCDALINFVSSTKWSNKKNVTSLDDVISFVKRKKPGKSQAKTNSV